MKKIFFDFNKRKRFPNPELASSLTDYCIGYGGDLKVDRLLAPYKKGIFPWYMEFGTAYWFSPDPRCVLFPDDLHISTSMHQLIRSRKFHATMDRDFKAVIKNCASVKRKNNSGTWINREFVKAYTELHIAGYAHSVEVWKDNVLVGGLYGSSLGKCFFGESMFSNESNASKFAFIHLVDTVKQLGFHFIDCQIYNPHLASLGAKNIPRSEFLSHLKKALKHETRIGKWMKE